MPGYTVQEIAAVVGAVIVGHQPHDATVKILLTDSRQVTDGRHSLFFAIKTARNDGHRFIGQLLADDVRMFVVSSLPNHATAQDAVFLLVDDTLAALQQLAAFHRQRFGIPVVGITGSNGKTIVKEWLAQILAGRETVAASPKSFNSQIGVPLSVWQLNNGHSIGVFEAGISQPGEMIRLESIIRPTIGLITNIGQAHASFFADDDQKTDEKLTLFSRADLLVYCRDHALIHSRLEATGLRKRIKTFSWGYSDESDLQVEQTEHTRQGTNIWYRLRHHTPTSQKPEATCFFIPFSDAASIENSLHCRALLCVLGYDPKTADQLLAGLPAIEMRLELREGINNCSIINDSYSNDITSLAVALDFLNQQKQHALRTVILSDIPQSGRDEQPLYTDVARLLRARGITRLVGIGEALARHRDLFTINSVFHHDTETFLHSLTPDTFSNETILIKGARIFGFERIVTRLQQKNHETVLETNLAALVHNLNFFRSTLRPGVKITAMVKAFSYGSGSFEIANALQFHHIDYLAVAYADEGFELRRAGITTPIMVMNPEQTNALALLKHRLEPEVYSIRQLQLLCQQFPESYNGEPLPVHLKLETGMHRLGIEESDCDRLITILRQHNRHIRVASVFSHLAASEDPGLDDFTAKQTRAFDRFSLRIAAAMPTPVLRHILNSSGIIRFPDAQYDMVRLGIGLYGIAPEPLVQQMLRNVNTLSSHISQVKTIEPGDSVGYGRKYTADRKTRLAIAPIGYADGLSRRLGNGNYQVTIRGQKAPLIGNISMDMCAIDVTSIPDATEGDVVTIFGSANDINAMALAMDTIPYEVLTGISRRVKRIYYEE